MESTDHLAGFSATCGKPVLLDLVEEKTCALADRSHTISDSFRRRTNFPNSDTTYRESKEILTVISIPCIDVIGSIEGEALASSIVLRGLDDYVASEDTVVSPSIRFYIYS